MKKRSILLLNYKNSYQNLFIYFCSLPSTKSRSIEYVPMWKVYGFMPNWVANDTNTKKIMLNVRMPENVEIPKNLPLKWSQQVTHSDKSWQQRLIHQRNSTSS